MPMSLYFTLRGCCIGFFAAISAWTIAQADPAEPLSALTRMPVKEITVFKDGHAFVMHAGEMPVDKNGSVQLDYLPTPIMGAFWPYSSDKRAKLAAVTASQQRVKVARTALTLPELLISNPGAEVWITEVGENKTPYEAKIIGAPERSSDELAATNPPGAIESIPQRGNVILLETAQGVMVKPIDQIKSVTFKNRYQNKIEQEEMRNRLTMNLNWEGAPASKASVGMLYLQKGVRWIPSYKIDLDGQGNATIQLQATLLNEMTDLDNITVHLVIGVPNFMFKDSVDPMSLQQTIAQLSPYFQPGAQTAGAFSNAIMTQTARRNDFGGFGGGGGEVNADVGLPPTPEVTGGEKSEDLFVFTVQNVSLRKGQRMVIPVAEYRMAYRDLYTLSIPITPPREVWQNSSGNIQQDEIERMMRAPKVQHKIRLKNNSQQPFTTAPALLVQGARALGQGMMTYTAPSGEVDITITTAADIKVKREDIEPSRQPNAVEWQDSWYAKINMSGKITLTNYLKKPVELEINRYVIGIIGSASHNGKAQNINFMEEDASSAIADWGNPYRPWWYGWPYWWHHLNGVGRFTWNLKLEPGKEVELSYQWHYFWR